MANLSTTRSLLGDLARSYKYKFEIETTVGGFNLTSLVGSYGGSNFLQVISNSCVACQIPSRGSQEINVNVGQHVMRLAGRQDTSGTITPDFIQTGDFQVYSFFHDWAGMCSDHRNDSQVSSASTLCNIVVTTYFARQNITDNQDSISMKYKIFNAYCNSCPDVAFADSTNDIIRFQPTLHYERLYISDDGTNTF